MNSLTAIRVTGLVDRLRCRRKNDRDHDCFPHTVCPIVVDLSAWVTDFCRAVPLPSERPSATPGGSEGGNAESSTVFSGLQHPQQLIDAIGGERSGRLGISRTKIPKLAFAEAED